MADDVDLPDTDEDLAPVGVPEGFDVYATKVWVEMTPILERAGRLKKSDAQTWKRYCFNLGRYWRAADDIRENGEYYWSVSTIQHVDGELNKSRKRNPAALTMEKLEPHLRAQEDRFGLSTLARTNLAAKGMRGGAGDPSLPGFGAIADDESSEDGGRPDPSSFN